MPLRCCLKQLVSLISWRFYSPFSKNTMKVEIGKVEFLKEMKTMHLVESTAIGRRVLIFITERVFLKPLLIERVNHNS